MKKQNKEIEEITIIPKEEKMLKRLLKMATNQQERQFLVNYWIDWCAFWRQKNKIKL